MTSSLAFCVEHHSYGGGGTEIEVANRQTTHVESEKNLEFIYFLPNLFTNELKFPNHVKMTVLFDKDVNRNKLLFMF